MSSTVKYVGLDVRKNTIAVAVTEDGKRADVRQHGEIANAPAALTKLLGKLGGPGGGTPYLLRGGALMIPSDRSVLQWGWSMPSSGRCHAAT
uniref:hypothetical protein n=1 Tax=Sphingomonas populi TaxID=2484750 RepID=UPI0013EECE6D|nr:hypothetical protein [Sphingomonas populi]